jgi:predicted nuclease with TOPRIM domain
MMATPGFRIRHLAFHGPNRPSATVRFGPGLNVIYGASETGKSFVVEAIDFMLGGKPPLRDIPQRVGYDRVLLGLETIAGQQYTLLRGAEGGTFRAYPGLHLDPPADDANTRSLAAQHSDKNSNNLSMFLLEHCGLAGKRVRSNKRGDTNSLSFRNIARLLIVTETEITEKRSPLSDGNPISDTPNFATFKLLLTGLDDGALVKAKTNGAKDQSREAQLELLDQLLDEYRERMSELTESPEELEDQLKRLETSIAQQAASLATTEADYRRLADQRRDLRERLEEGRDRRSEIDALLERFTLLDRHYVSDVARLRGIEEGGTLFEVLGQSPCPLCGADPAHHRKDGDCDGNVSAVVAAAQSEIKKIELLRTELGDTVQALRREAGNFDQRLPRIQKELETASENLDGLVSPRLAQLRAAYADFADKRAGVREALGLFRTVQDMENRRAKIDNSPEDEQSSPVSDGDLPTATADAFAQHVEALLTAWHFPGAERVHFDSKKRDLIIAGKDRTARGKGLRAITHAAFTVGLLDYCRTKATPHPGFVILDSPLLAYRAPEGDEDDLRGTDLNEQFYSYLADLPDDRQVIIVENIDPPSTVKARREVEMFSKNPHSGRYGFFPTTSEESLT